MTENSDNNEIIERTEIAFLAGVSQDDQPVFESLQVEIVNVQEELVRLSKSPLFVRNLAAGDVIKLINPAIGEYEIERRSGNLSIRVFRRQGINAVADFLNPAMEKLGGSVDLQTEAALSYSIHFSIGFSLIEKLLDSCCERFIDTVWYYGNVYDPKDGSTPLLWWQEFTDLE